MIVFLIALILWITPMFVADNVLGNKNYNNLTGFVLGFLLGWIGVLIALMMPFKPKDEKDAVR